MTDKSELRDEVWSAMRAEGVARFPGAVGRIPNFTGVEAAAERLRSTEAWRRARTLKANPDAAQWPVRQRALEDGKTVFMAVPRLADENPFFLLDPDRLAGTPGLRGPNAMAKASTIKGASRSAVRVGLDELEPVDLVVAGCVAAGEDGRRLGKGGGYSDLEFALASEAGLIGPATVIATTVHDLQVRPAGMIPVVDHDMRLDLIATPTRVIEVRRRLRGPNAMAGRRQSGRIRWDELSEDKIAQIPLLAGLKSPEILQKYRL